MAGTLEELLREFVIKIVRAEVRLAVREALQPDEFLSPKHAARIADVSPQTIRRWVGQKKLRRYGTGPRVLRVSRRDLDAWLANRTTESDNLSPEELADQMFGTSANLPR